jgi:uncharacterized protein YjbJ (UPF0337 family)
MTQGWNDESSTSTTQTAKEEAGHVASQASQQASQVAGTVQEQGAKVAAEARDQARNLLDEARSQINEQAGAQQQRAADGLRSLASELEGMSSGTEFSSGIGTDLVRQASEQVQRAAGWLESKDADGVLDDVRNWARRNPGTFLLAAAGAGLVAGRLTRATTQAARSEQSTDSSAPYATAPATDYPTAPITPPMAAPAAPASVPSTGYSTTGYTSPAPSTYGTGDLGAGTDPTGAPGTYGQEPLR